MSGRTGLDLAQSTFQLTLQVFQPLLEITPSKLDLTILDNQLLSGYVSNLTVTSHSLKDETLNLAWEGPDGTQFAANPIVIPAGQTVQVPFTLKGQNVADGDYTGRIPAFRSS